MRRATCRIVVFDIDDDGPIERDGNQVYDRRVEVDVRFRRTNGHDQAVPGGKAVAFLSWACAPPPLRWVDGNKAAICQLGGSSAPDILVQRTAMPLPVAKSPIRVLGINRDLGSLGGKGYRTGPCRCRSMWRRKRGRCQ